MLQIKDVMTPQAEVISPDATTEDAASLMKTLDIGVLPVCDDEGLVGVLTDRDLVVRVLAVTRDPKAMLVGEAMPANAGQFSQRPGHGTAYHQLYIVKWSARRLVDEQHPFWMAREMATRVPPALRKIQSAGKGECLVDDDHLLMMGGSHRMRAVLIEVQAPVRGKL